MKKMLYAGLLMPLFASAASADDDFRCGNVPPDRWISKEEIAERAKKAGVHVRRVEVDDGCYEVKGYLQDGLRVEIRMHPQAGTQISIDGD